MRTSSTRLRMSAALAVTTLGLFSLGGSAFAGENNGRGAGDRDGRGGAKTATAEDTTDKSSPSEAKAEQFQEDEAAYTAPESRHPSGKDRMEEPGGSGTQGKSTSDPDGDLNGGADKPGGEGGISTGDQDGNNGCGNDQDFEDDNNGWCGRKPTKAKSTRPSNTPPVVEGENEVRCPGKDEVAAGGTMDDDCDVAGGDLGGDAGGEAGGDAEGDTLTGGTVAPGAVLGTQLQNGAAGEAEGVETRVLGVTVERGVPAGTAAATAATGGTETSVLGASFARGAALARTGFGTTALAVLGIALLAVGLLLSRSPKDEHFA